jgi:ATP-dependent DNA helicase RecQ
MDAIVTTLRSGQTEVSAHAIAALQTVQALKGRFGINHIVQVLRGEDPFGAVSSEQQQLPTYGALSDWSGERVRSLLRWLQRKAFVTVADKRFGSLSISPEGEAFLAAPAALVAREADLRNSYFDRMLYVMLRKARLELSRETGKPPFEIFTDFTLHELVQQRPADAAALRAIPGIGDYKANRYGPAILRAIGEVQAKQAEEKRNEFLKKAHGPAAQAVKTLFESGMDIDAIAASRGVQPATVRNALQLLHNAGQIDLAPWIERNLDASALERGVSFFRQSQAAKLREAYEALGLDYDTLRFCRLYVSRMNAVRQELPMAS